MNWMQRLSGFGGRGGLGVAVLAARSMSATSAMWATRAMRRFAAESGRRHKATLLTTSVRGLILGAGLGLVLGLGAGTALAQEEADPWRDADQLYVGGKYAEAGDAYKALFAEEPRCLHSLQTKIKAAECFARAGKRDEALACYDLVISLSDPCADVANAFAGIQLFWMEQGVGGKANIYAGQGDYERAARVCQDFLASFSKKSCNDSLLSKELQTIVLTQRIAMAGAGYWRQAGKPAEAVALYDTVTALGQAKRDDDNKREVIQGLHEAALAEKAQACVEAGNAAKADETIKLLQAEFPFSPRLARAGVIQAAIKGGDRTRAEAAAAAETQASTTIAQAKKAADDGNAELAIRSLDAVIADKSNVRSAMSAQMTKGDILLDSERYRESRDALLPVLEHLKQTAPKSHAYRHARSLTMRGLWKQLDRQRTNREQIAEQDVNQLLALCDDVIATDSRGGERAHAYTGLVDWLCSWSRFEEALQRGHRRLAELKDDPERGEYWEDTAVLYMCMGIAARYLKQPQEALKYFREALVVVEPVAHSTNDPGLHGLLSSVYYRIWQTLRQSGASAEEVDKAAQDLLTRYPASPAAGFMRQTSKK